MNHFPQMSSHAIGQYPIRKRTQLRTIVNESLDGSRIKLADEGAGTLEWSLKFLGMTDDEWDALSQLFHDVEGRMGDFTFLDPTDNLLLWSEKLDDPAWIRSAPLTITPGLADPNGGTNASRLTNSGGAALALEQTVNGPASFHYAFSVQARAAGDEELVLRRSTLSASQSASFQIGPEWRRIVLSGNFAAPEEFVQFGVEVAPGASVEIFGLQVEAQAGASRYKKTLSRCGIYPQARFAGDVLARSIEAPNQNSCAVRILSRA